MDVEFDWFNTANHKNSLRDLDSNAWDIEDIAVGLARQCRYNGQYPMEKGFYSVAEHSVILSEFVEDAMGPDREACLYALMHDASEAYLSDIITPFKAIIPGYKDVEKLVMDAILRRHNCRPHPLVVEKISLLDRNLVVDETIELQGKPLIPGDRLGVKILCLDPMQAYTDFLNRYRYITRNM